MRFIDHQVGRDDTTDASVEGREHLRILAGEEFSDRAAALSVLKHEGAASEGEIRLRMRVQQTDESGGPLGPDLVILPHDGEVLTVRHREYAIPVASEAHMTRERMCDDARVARLARDVNRPVL